MIYYLVPLLYFTITSSLYGGLEVLRVIFISVVPLLFLIIKPIRFIKFRIWLIPLVSLALTYLISFFVNNQNYVTFLIGQYRRNYGFLVLIGLILIFLISANSIAGNEQKLVKILYSILLVGLMHAILQILDLDPVRTEYQTIGLTLGNPNFASAFLGMLSIVPLTQVFYNSTKYNICLIHALVFSLIGVVILYTGSLQGLILYLFNLLLVLCWYLYSAKIIRIPRPKILLLTTSIAFIVIFFFVIAVIENLPSNFVSKVDSAIQFRSRLGHWKLGIRVGQDNFWTGVGIDNLLSHSALYITKEMAQGYQGVVLTDKTHNVFIDHFANGGIFAVISWLIFTVLVSSFALKTMFFIQKSSNIAAMIVLFGIWMTYTIQTLISPDHLYLILIGMVSSGALVGISVNNKAPKILNGNSDQ